MADKQISELDAAGALAGANLLVVGQSGVSKKDSLTNLAAFVNEQRANTIQHLAFSADASSDGGGVTVRCGLESVELLPSLSNAANKALLESLAGIGAGNVDVSGDWVDGEGHGLDIELKGDFAGANVPLLSFESTLGATSVSLSRDETVRYYHQVTITFDNTPNGGTYLFEGDEYNYYVLPDAPDGWRHRHSAPPSEGGPIVLIGGPDNTPEETFSINTDDLTIDDESATVNADQFDDSVECKSLVLAIINATSGSGFLFKDSASGTVDFDSSPGTIGDAWSSTAGGDPSGSDPAVVVQVTDETRRKTYRIPVLASDLIGSAGRDGSLGYTSPVGTFAGSLSGGSTITVTPSVTQEGG